jgi:iron complex outermembrane receptor protein
VSRPSRLSAYQGGVGGNVNAMGNLPLIDGKLAVRVVAFDSESPGYVDNVFLNQKNTNTSYSQGGRLLARFQPADNFTLDGSFIYQRSFGNDGRWDESAGAFESTFETQLPYDDEFKLFNLIARWDLGPVTATAILSDMERREIYTTTDTSPFFAANYTGAYAAPDCAPIDNSGNPPMPTPRSADA